nr:hypothetical protein [Tanacetum cinerariifolium]
IVQSFALLTVADEPASPQRDVSQGEVCPTDSGFIADQDRANIAKTSTLPYESTSRVTSLAADKGTQALEIIELKVRVKFFEARQGEEEVATERVNSDTEEIRLDEGEVAAEKVSDDTEEMATVLITMDATSVLSSGGVQVVPTAAAVAPANVSISTGSVVVPTTSTTISTVTPIFATATTVTPYTRRKVKDFRGMTFKEVEAKFNSVWKQIEDFIPMGSKDEAKRIKRKGINLEQESAKKQKISEEVPEEVKSSNEVPKEKIKELIQLVPIKEIDREDLNQLWALVKETLSIRPATDEKEMKLWVELKRLYEPDVIYHIWTHTQHIIHAPVEWRLYVTCRVHHVMFKDLEIFMLVEKNYPLRKALALVMICYKMQVENYS